jgi:benzoylformate decarboxylase
MATKTGRFALIEQFLADGLNVMFGNPGTVEQGFLDSLMDYSDLNYILTLQESIAVGAADGMARAIQKPVVVQLHSGVGLGNAIGMLYQAKRGHAPLVVINSDAGTLYDAMDAQMACDAVAFAAPVTKWAARVTHPASLLRMVRRAIKIAGTAPYGPVFLSVPMDVLDAPCVEDIVPTSFPSTRVTPAPALVEQAAHMLVGASHPMIIMGDGVSFSEASSELTQVAEVLGADVWGSNSSEVNISATHPLYKGNLGHMFGDHSSAITSKADAVLIVGTYVFPEVFPALSGVFSSTAKVVHIDLNLYEIAKNFPVDLGLLGDPKLTLAQLASAIEQAQSAEQRQSAKSRVTQADQVKQAQLQKELEADQAANNQMPLRPAQFMRELAAQLPKDAYIFDEALTTSPDLTRYLPPVLPGHFFQTRGGSLGVGIPGAIGVKVAFPDKEVWGFTGDGGAMYTIQALWTAAHHNIKAKFVICNNHSYKLLKLNIQQYWRERSYEERDFPASFDLNNPDMHFADMAKGMGVAGVRVEKPEEIGPAIKQALEHDGPFLIDLVISDDVPNHQVHVPHSGH